MSIDVSVLAMGERVLLNIYEGSWVTRNAVYLGKYQASMWGANLHRFYLEQPIAGRSWKFSPASSAIATLKVLGLDPALPNCWTMDNNFTVIASRLGGIKTSPQMELTSSSQPDMTNLTDWKLWRHNVPGECPCGISRQDCSYHK